MVSVPRELAENALDELYELRGERAWWKDEPRCGYQMGYQRLCGLITELETILGRQDKDVKISTAGKQTKAFWRSEEWLRRKWEAEKPVTKPEKAYGQYLRTCERLQGHAAGWIAGVAWARRNLKAKSV